MPKIVILANRLDLLTAANQVKKSTGRERDINKHIHFVFKDNHLILTATNNNLQLQSKLAAALKEGEMDLIEFNADASKFANVVSSLVGDEVKITISETRDKVTVSAGRSRLSLDMLNTPFPFLEFKPAQSVKLSIKDLLSAIQNTAFSMAKNDARYFLNGMKIELQEGKFRTIATDGHRLALNEREYQGTADEISIIVPEQTIKNLLAMLKVHEKSEDNITFELNHSMLQVAFADGNIFTTTLIDGRFPDYRRVLPRFSNYEYGVDRLELLSALKRLSIVSNERFASVRLEFCKDMLKLEAKVGTGNTAGSDEMNVAPLSDNAKAQDLVVGFNINYLIDVLNTVTDERVNFKFADSTSAVAIKAEQDNTSTFVVMPMRL